VQKRAAIKIAPGVSVVNVGGGMRGFR